MANMTGADAEQLESSADRLYSIGTQVGSISRPIRSQLYSSPWEGRNADRFRGDWDRVHGPALAEAERFLHDAAGKLRANAADQRRISGGTGTYTGSVGIGSAKGNEDLKGDIAEIRKILEAIGVPYEKISGLLDKLKFLNELGILLGPLKALAENEALDSALSVVGDALDFAKLALDFVTVIADHPELPLDEAIVLGASTLAVGLAVGAGVKAASKAIGGLVAGMFSGGVATVAGFVVGEVVGNVLSDTFDSLDENFDITGHITDTTLETYRFAKERDFDMQRIAMDGARMGVEATIDGAQNIAVDVGGAVGNAVGDGMNAIGDGAKGIYHGINPFD